jgi:3-isopropylmalate dehydrogenase
MFEPIHGSAPKYKDQNVASPIAAIMAAQMMLDFLGEKESAADIENAVASILSTGRLTSLDARSGVSTTEVGDMVVRELHSIKEGTRIV